MKKLLLVSALLAVFALVSVSADVLSDANKNLYYPERYYSDTVEIYNDYGDWDFYWFLDEFGYDIDFYCRPVWKAAWYYVDGTYTGCYWTGYQWVERTEYRRWYYFKWELAYYEFPKN